jgi:predicted transcriptional regulator
MSSTLVEYVLNMKGNLSSGIQSATEHANKLESSLSGVQKIAGAIGLAFGAYQIVSFAKESFEAFHALEQVTAKVEANLESTNGAAGMGMKDLQGYAVELSNKIQASRAEVTDMQSQMLTFPAITKDVFAQSMGLVADIAKQTNHGLSETAIMYGKALNDPAEGLQKMMRYGVMFTAQEKKTIETLQASGKLIQAQKFMMEAIAHSGYAGVAEKMFNADIMSKYNKLMERAKLVTGEWVESMMKELLPTIEGIASGISSLVGWIKEMYGWMSDHKQIITDTAIELASVSTALMAITIYTHASAIGLWALGIAANFLTIAGTALTAVTWLFSAALWSTGIPEIVLAVAALTAGVIALSHHFGGFTNAMSATWDYMKLALNFAIKLWKATGEIILGVLMIPIDRGKMLKQGLKDYVDNVRDSANQAADIWHNKSKDYQNASVIGSGDQGGYGMMGGLAVMPGIKGLDLTGGLIPKNKAGATPTKPESPVATPKTKAEGQKTINIHVAYNGAIMPNLTISTMNIKEGIGSLKEKLTAVFTGAANNSLVNATM